MAESKQEIINAITGFIKQRDGSYPYWYVGISRDARNRLFQEHNVDENKDLWIYRTATSHLVAREVEDYFVNTLGTDGAPGGGDEYTNKVYAYKKSAHTNP